MMGVPSSRPGKPSPTCPSCVTSAAARRPGAFELRDVHLRLRFDANGDLLTKLPGSAAAGGPLPDVQVRAGSLTLEQEGRQPFTLEGISLTLQPALRTNLSGVLDDPVWGSFDVSGRVEKSGAFSITLNNNGVALTLGMLKSLPFVPPSLWSTIEVDGPSVPLTFTLAVATQAPLVRYTVAFDRARVTLPQPDRQPLVASPARGVLDGNEDGFKLTGQINDAYWGSWTVQAGLVASTGAISLDLTTPDAVVDQKKLSLLPYVPKNVWQQVQASGRTPARPGRPLPHKPDVHYRVELKPRDVRVHIASISLDAVDAAGSVVIEDSRVLLGNVTGRTASGVIAANGDLDFRRDPVRLQFDVNVRGLVLKELPKKWELPAQIEGKITGQANLTVSVIDGAPQTHGSGKGRIDDAKLIGFRTKEPIDLDLTADGKTFRFIPRSVLLQILMVAALPPSGPARPPCPCLDARCYPCNRRGWSGKPSPRSERSRTGSPAALRWC